MTKLSRRKLIITGLAATAGTSGLAVATSLARRYGLIPPDGAGIYGPGETLTYGAQRILTRHSLAREFPRSQISKTPFANEVAPLGEGFQRLQQAGFIDWRLAVDGMVARPASFSLLQLKSFPSRSQITHLACEEGWSYIAEWTGVPLSHVLDIVGTLPQARYVVYRSIQPDWWESIDMADALHPQTFITYGMNGGELPVRFGGPLRLRVPRQLGYKSLKYITRLTLTDNLKRFGKGLGSAEPEGVHAAIQALRLDHPILCGWSYGPLVILDYIRHYGEDRISGVNFVGGVTKLGSDEALSVLSPEFLSLVPGFFATGVEDSVRSLESLLRLCFGQELSPEDLYLMMGYNVSVPPYVRQALFSRSLDNDDLLEKIRKPVLITHGANDAIVKPATVDQHKAGLPHAQIQLMANTEHAAFWDQASEFNQCVRAFAESV